MPIFICEKCSCVDNTALAHFWVVTDEDGNPVYGPDGKIQMKDFRCTQCKTGTWHNKFPKEEYDSEKHNVTEMYFPPGMREEKEDAENRD